MAACPIGMGPNNLNVCILCTFIDPNCNICDSNIICKGCDANVPNG